MDTAVIDETVKMGLLTWTRRCDGLGYICWFCEVDGVELRVREIPHATHSHTYDLLVDGHRKWSRVRDRRRAMERAGREASRTVPEALQAREVRSKEKELAGAWVEADRRVDALNAQLGEAQRELNRARQALEDFVHEKVV